MEIYTRMIGGHCVADMVGQIQCNYYVMDGGVVAAGENCYD